MANVAIYLNFQGTTEEAFNFYKSVFKTEFSSPIMRIGDMPPNPGAPTFSETDKNCVMHVSLPIIGGTELMGTDMLESLGHKVIVGNNTTISLQLDSKEEADEFYGLLSNGGSDKAPMRDEFWGYWGCCLDKFGIRWMFNVIDNLNS
ncbi:VOC family protein [Aequorivita echinoideorum]|uniref:VOC family protein n=1 Tax=Aequorivita echinoideorum TaxID=1549647 RepID=A0ABS5S4Y5_9FLAO|nr:VOC family protein [Aequorivita echinoideorum]MBT0608286.1 VOC family protein [Aequorivita echinoideorum]